MLLPVRDLAGRARIRRDERGDVPGWVLITVMTVALVGAIWAVADDQLTDDAAQRARLGGQGLRC